MSAPATRSFAAASLPRSNGATAARPAQLASGVPNPADNPWWLEPVDHDEHDSWMLSYLDILTLLLTLSVVIIAITHAQLQKQTTAPPAPTVELADVSMRDEARKNPAADLSNSAVALQAPQPITPASVDVASDASIAVVHQSTPDTTGDAEPTTPPSENVADVPALRTQTVATPVPESTIAETAAIAMSTEQNAEVIESVASNTLESGNVGGDHQSVQDRAADDKDSLASLSNTGWMQVHVGERGVMIELGEEVLFTSASAALATQSVPALDALVNVLSEMPYVVWIEGHSDNTPIATATYPSNWELSTARATAVTRYMIERGITSQRLRAVGYGDTQPRTSNDTEAGRTQNRRVVFRIEMPPALSAR